MAKKTGGEHAPREKPRKRPGVHKKSRNKQEKRQQKGWHLSFDILVLGMKEKKLTITSKDISQKQWSNLILELNLIKKAWSSYASLDLQGAGVKKIIAHGTRNFDSKVIEEDE